MSSPTTATRNFALYLIARMGKEEAQTRQNLRDAIEGGAIQPGHLGDAMANAAAAFEIALRRMDLETAAGAAVTVLLLARDLAHALGKVTAEPVGQA